MRQAAQDAQGQLVLAAEAEGLLIQGHEEAGARENHFATGRLNFFHRNIITHLLWYILYYLIYTLTDPPCEAIVNRRRKKRTSLTL